MVRLGATLAGFLVLGSAFEARASEGEAVSDTKTLSGEAEVGIFAERTAEHDAASVSPMMRLGIRARPSVEFGIAAGAATYFEDGPNGQTREAHPSNISIGTRFIRERHGDKYRLAHIGFQFALPTGFATTANGRKAFDYALGSRGGWSPWEWEPQTLGIVLPAGARWQLVRGLVLGLDAGIAGMFAAGGQTDAPALAAQLAGIAYYAFPWFGTGVRMQAVWNGRHPDDNSQAAVAPFIDANICRRNSGGVIQGRAADTDWACPVRVVAKANINLDQPYGFASGDAMRIWGVVVGLGWGVF